MELLRKLLIVKPRQTIYHFITEAEEPNTTTISLPEPNNITELTNIYIMQKFLYLQGLVFHQEALINISECLK